MARLIVPQRSLGMQNRRLVTDANGAPCCCGANCCGFAGSCIRTPIRTCENPDLLCPEGRNATYYRMTVVSSWVYLFESDSRVSRGARRYRFTRSVATGATVRAVYCKSSNRYQPPFLMSAVIEGALFEQTYTLTDEPDQNRFIEQSTDFAAIGTASGLSTAQLPVVSGEYQLGQTTFAGAGSILGGGNDQRYPVAFNYIYPEYIYSRPYGMSFWTLFWNPCTNTNVVRRSGFWLNGVVEKSLDEEQVFNDSCNSGSVTYNMTDDATWTFRVSPETRDARVRSSIRYTANWTRDWCFCNAGPTELTPQLPPLAPSETVVRQRSALEML